jgi:uncharacterized protein YkwD
VLAAVFFIIGIYYNIGQNGEDDTVLIGNKGVNPNKNTSGLDAKPNIKQEKTGTTPKQGIASLIGKKSSTAVKLYGKPTRIDMSSYGYDWWIYNAEKTKYFQLAVEKGKIVSAYGIGTKSNVYPFRVGQTIDEIYSSLYIETYVDLDTKSGSYRFELSEEEMNMKPLIKLGQIYAQLYLDKFTGTVSSVRFLNKETLIKQRPYELTYRGELIQPLLLTEEEWAKVEDGNKKQIFDITNIMRDRFKVPDVLWDEATSQVAYLHSKDMAKSSYFSHTSPTKGELKNRLEKEDISYKFAGENIAAEYVDAIAAMEGWLNSKGHRETLLNEDFTYLGVGVYKKYYTQDFIGQ